VVKQLDTAAAEFDLVLAHAIPPDRVLAQLASGPEGLTGEEARLRRLRFGPNRLDAAPPPGPWQIFVSQFKSVLILVLLAATAVSSLLGEWLDAMAILVIVLVNAIVGFLQEYRAEQALAALQALTAPEARVRRDGRRQAIPAADLVPGDRLVLEAGDVVAADARLLRAARLRCGEAALTGEAEPVDKVADAVVSDSAPVAERATMVFAGTTVVDGTAEAVVVATGMETEVGRIARLIDQAAPEAGTPLQRRLAEFGRSLVRGIGVIVVLIGLLGWWRGMGHVEVLLTSVSLAVAAIPEGLPAVVTLALALGVQRMARRQALVRRLAAVETLGATTVIASDKTGTLTAGDMRVRALALPGLLLNVGESGYSSQLPASAHGMGRQVWQVLVGCNDAMLQDSPAGLLLMGDPTETALLLAAAACGQPVAMTLAGWRRVAEVPFDAISKRMTVLAAYDGGQQVAWRKGAFEAVLPDCDRILTADGERPLTETDRRELGEQLSALATNALRVLAAAYRPMTAMIEDIPEAGYVFAGMVGLQDPPRPEAKEAVSRCRAAGIRVVMITGDHPDTATAVARELGIAGPEDDAVTGAELERMDDATLQARVPQTAVYARVSPEHKWRVVRAWQANGAVIAMTGDGVNDAPAVHAADVGIAMGRTGTAVTQGAADVVLADDNFATLVAAVEEGRTIYGNIRKTIGYLLSGNAGELLFVTLCLLVGLPMPLLPIHLLWINLISDGLPALGLAIDPAGKDIMRRPPRPLDERMVDGQFAGQLLAIGALTAAMAMAVYLPAVATTDLAMARTEAFAAIVAARLLLSFTARQASRPLWRVGLFSNLPLLVIVAGSFLLQPWLHGGDWLSSVLKVETMDWTACGRVVAMACLPVITLETGKALAARLAPARSVRTG
jgi:Ca2+-transporting ATPase